jgi:hypothetical protein
MSPRQWRRHRRRLHRRTVFSSHIPREAFQPLPRNCDAEPLRRQCVRCGRGIQVLRPAAPGNVRGKGLREPKKEAPAFDEGEEARLCGGLWTNSLLSIISAAPKHVNYFNENFRKIISGESGWKGLRVPALRPAAGKLVRTGRAFLDGRCVAAYSAMVGHRGVSDHGEGITDGWKGSMQKVCGAVLPILRIAY